MEISSDTSAHPIRMTSPPANQPCQEDWFVAPRSRVRKAAMWAAGKTAAGLQTLRGNGAADGFGILMYHRVADYVGGGAEPTLNVTPDQLRRQLSGLLARGFECWPLSKLVDAHHESQRIPSTAFAITFDDG